MVNAGWLGKQLCRKEPGSPGGQVESEPATCPCGKVNSILSCFRRIRMIYLFITSVAVTELFHKWGSYRSLDSYGFESNNPQVHPICLHHTPTPQHILLQLPSTVTTCLAAKWQSYKYAKGLVNISVSSCHPAAYSKNEDL